MEQFKQNIDKFTEDFRALERRHAAYAVLIDKVKEEQAQCTKAVKHNRLFMRLLSDTSSILKKTCSIPEQVYLETVQHDFIRKELILRDMEQTLPEQNGLYLSIVLGSVSTSLTTKQDKFNYKNNYERFKIIVSAISALLSFMLFFFLQNRIIDSFFHFLLVWYYCTLTIRERILIQNGSRIKGWWRIYHFISTACHGTMLIWPRSLSYDAFRDQFMLFSFYLNIVHCVQYHYQTGCMYKLRALGQRPVMDITVDGYMSWMSRHLAFLLPFLIIAYAFQAYNAYVLYYISQKDFCHEWQVLVVSMIFALLSTGNILTTCHVIRQKLFFGLSPVWREQLRHKYSVSNSEPDNETNQNGANFVG